MIPTSFVNVHKPMLTNSSCVLVVLAQFLLYSEELNVWKCLPTYCYTWIEHGFMSATHTTKVFAKTTILFCCVPYPLLLGTQSWEILPAFKYCYKLKHSVLVILINTHAMTVAPVYLHACP